MKDHTLPTVIALIIDHSRWSVNAVIMHIIQMPALVFFLGGAAGILFLIWLAKSQNNRDAKANWREQIVNSFSQCCIMLGILF